MPDAELAEVSPNDAPGLGLLSRPDLQCEEVIPVLFESRLFEREDNLLAVIEVSVTDTGDIGEMHEAAARHLGESMTPQPSSPSNQRTAPGMRSSCLATPQTYGTR